MKTVLMPLIDTLIDFLRSRASLHLEMLASRQQLAMIADRDCKRIRFRSSERIFWVWLYSLWPTCLQTLIMEAFPFDTTPRYLLRDRVCMYGDRFRSRVKSLGIEDDGVIFYAI